MGKKITLPPNSHVSSLSEKSVIFCLFIADLPHNRCFGTHSYAHTQTQTLSSLSLLKNSDRAEERKKNNLHNPIPVVSGRHPEECEEGHAEVVKGSVATKTLAWVFVRTL